MNFSHLVTAFFIKFLKAELDLSDNTIASYSDCMKMLIKFACKRFSVKPEKLCIEKFDRELIIDFLDYLERDRKNAPSTRNQRLAALKSFFHFLARDVPELMHLNATVQAIREKKTSHQPPPSMTVEEVTAVIAAPDASTVLGARDKVLMQLAYNSGGRVQELADLILSDITAGTVTLTGKGRKTRTVPLWDETVELISHYLQLREHADIHSGHLFVNIKGQPMTRFGLGRRVEKHAQAAALQCPSLRGRKITPHVFRHTTALHLLDAGNDIVQVQQWLGHSDLRTTSEYLEVSIERKRAALAKLPPPSIGDTPEIPKWKQPNLMEFLSKLSNGVMLRETG